jgi:hypothetical protein
MARHVLGRVAMRSSTSTSFRYLGLVAFLVLFAMASGCIAVDSPPAYASREKLRSEHVGATPGVMFGAAPNSLESSLGRIAIETLEVDQPNAFSNVFSRVTRLTLAGARPADVTCVHERVGSAYPPGFDFAEAAAFACRGVVESTAFTLAVERGCYDGSVTIDGSDRYRLTRGKVRIAGLEAPSNEVSLLDTRGAMVAAFDLVASMSFDVWFGEAAQPKPSRATLIIAAAAMHDWAVHASALKLDACN